MPDFLAVCEQAARAGGAALLDWVERFSVREKGPADLVTEADVASQEAVRRVVLGAFPDHDFLSEEEAPATKTARSEPHYRWIVDPLDGTTNYVHRIPEYAVSLALERAGEVVAATVFNPVHGECYTAAKGCGAYLNGQRLHVSGVTELKQALVAASFPPKVAPDSPVLIDFARIIVALAIGPADRFGGVESMLRGRRSIRRLLGSGNLDLGRGGRLADRMRGGRRDDGSGRRALSARPSAIHRRRLRTASWRNPVDAGLRVAAQFAVGQPFQADGGPRNVRLESLTYEWMLSVGFAAG